MGLAQKGQSPYTLSLPPNPALLWQGSTGLLCVRLAQKNRQHMASHNQPYDLILSDCYFYGLLLISIN